MSVMSLALEVLFVAVGYVLSLGPALWIGERYACPDWAWNVYWPLFKYWGDSSEWLATFYYDGYLCWWTEWLPYDYLIPRMDQTFTFESVD
ncbi:MAG: hypothetical protein DWQ29_15205 [Planctomycetota bacterium]|nr:MAG: hypothetical protein DWQ29_15205 [Planctomycetota bacterium]